MKQALIAAVLSSAFLAACAAPGGSASAGGGTAAAASGTQYCMKDKLQSSGDVMMCNWAASAREACETINLTAVKKSAIAGEPANAGRCGNGQWLVVVGAR